MKVSCIIPFFNEGERIGKVLDQVVKIKSIDEIICVDDGSTDEASEFVKKQYPKIKIIVNPKNSGKTGAIKAGLNTAKGEYVLLLDADLRDFDYREVERAVHKMLEKHVDMIILRRIYALLTLKLVRGDILISGDRILKKTMLEKILQKPVKRFQLEFAINQYMFDNKKHVYWMPSSARNTYKFNKYGYLRGWFEMIAVSIDIISYLGMRDYLRQVLFFCRKELV